MSKTPEQLAEEYATPKFERYDEISGYQKAKKYAFLDGYKAAQEEADTCEHILDMSKMVDANGWVSVKDRLPELRQKVLVWYNNGYEVAYLQKFEPPKLQYPQFNNVEMFEWCFGDFEDFDVTHWQPLPEPPKEEK